VSSELSQLVSLTEICHFCRLPSRWNGVVCVDTGQSCFPPVVGERNTFETLTRVPSALITLPRFIYTYVRSLCGKYRVSTDCLSARVWLTDWLVGLRPRCGRQLAYFCSIMFSGQSLAYLSDTPVVGTRLDKQQKQANKNIGNGSELDPRVTSCSQRPDRPPCYPLLNPLNAELNPTCHLLALAGAHHFVDVSRMRVNFDTYFPLMKKLTAETSLLNKQLETLFPTLQ
jgi:hypothetical protein